MFKEIDYFKIIKIATFMGYINNGCSSDGFLINPETNYDEDISEMKYDTSWDWLMPVVHKCLVICNDLMLDEWEGGFSDAFLSCSIATLYKKVTDFIEWYNKEIK